MRQLHWPRYYIGVDLGQAQDYTAIVVLESLQAKPEEGGIPPRDAKRSGEGGHIINVRHIERARGIPYQRVAERLKELVQDPQLRTIYPDNRLVGGKVLIMNEHSIPPGLAVDATGVGRAIVDLLRSYDLTLDAVTLTAGEKTHKVSGYYRVPKRDLVYMLVSAVQSGWLRISDDLEMGAQLKHELLNFKMKTNLKTGNESFETWREKDHDDIVLGLGMAVFSCIPRSRRRMMRGLHVMQPSPSSLFAPAYLDP